MERLAQLAKDWGEEVEGHVHVDSSAAIGIIGRRGCGKMRHVKVGMLWIQEKQENEELYYRKVKGTDNPADALTKSLSSPVIQKYLEDPLIIGGKKFDMRIYLFCRSYNPLILYLYRSGFCRFTHTRYTPNDVTNLDKHLTNVAV